MSNRFWISTVAVAGILALGLAAWAIERGPWEHRFGGHHQDGMAPRLLAMLENDHFRSELGLSDQQTEKLRQIIVDAEKSSIKTRAEMAVRHIELRELLRADNPNRDTVLKKVREISDLRGEMMKQHVEALLNAKTVLTPEQQKKIHGFMEHRRMGEHGHERPGPHHPPAPPSPPAKPQGE